MLEKHPAVTCAVAGRSPDRAAIRVRRHAAAAAKSPLLAALRAGGKVADPRGDDEEGEDGRRRDHTLEGPWTAAPKSRGF